MAKVELKHEYEEKFPSHKAGSMSYIGKKAKGKAIEKKMEGKKTSIGKVLRLHNK